MVDRYSSECAELCHFPNDNGDWVYYEDYQRLEADLETLKKEMVDHAGLLLCEKHSNHWGEFYTCPCCHADKAESEKRRLINIAGEALGLSEYQRDQDTVEVLAHHAKRLGEELAAVKGELAECRHRYAIKATSAEGESSILMGEIERLKAELMSLCARCERLEAIAYPDGPGEDAAISCKRYRELEARCERLEGALMHIKGLYENPSLTDSSDLYQIAKKALEVPRE